MSVYITDDELATFAKNGFDRNAVKRTVDTYRSQGMSDSDIRAKVDARLADWNTQAEPQAAPQQPKQESVLDTTNRLLESTARGIPVLGAAYNPLMAGMDATSEYILDKLGVPVVQKPDGTPATWRERYDRLMRKAEEKQYREAAAFPKQTLGAGVVGGMLGGMGANAGASAGKGLSMQIANALKTGVPVAAIDAGLREKGNLYDKAYAAARGGAIASVLTPPLVTAGYGISKGIDWTANKIANIKFNHAINKPVEEITKAQRHVLKQALGSEARVDAVLEEAKRQGKTLAELGNDNINRIIMKAESVSPAARTTISDYKEQFDSELPQKLDKVLNEKVSAESGAKTIEEIGDFFNEQAKPYYQSAYNTKIPAKYLAQTTKDKQFVLIQENNPMTDSYHVGIRKPSDIKTFQEAMADPESFVYPDYLYNNAVKDLQRGKVTVYSSKPIKQGSFVSTSKMMAKDYAGGGTIYEKEIPLSKIAWINGHEGQFADTSTKTAKELLGKSFYQNKIINNAVKKVDADYANVFGGRSKVKVDDLQYWDGVKSKLDHMIAAETNSAAPDGRKIANLMEAKSELTGSLDALNPNYKIARDISSNSFDIKRAYNTASKAFRADMTPDKLKTTMGNMTPAEQNAVKIGVRDTLSGMFGKTQDPTASFGKLLPPNAQQNIKFLLGEKNGQELIDFARNVHNINKALYAAKGNSLTAPRMVMAEEAIGPLTNLAQGKPMAAASQVVGKAAQKAAKLISKTSDDKLYNTLATYILTGKNPAISQTPIKTTPTNYQSVLQALSQGVRGAKAVTPYIQTLPITTSGVTNDQKLLKALGY